MFDNAKRRIEDTKQYVYEHRAALSFTAGLFTAVGIQMYVDKTHMRQISLACSPEHLQKLIDMPEGAIEWVKGRTTVTVLNEDHVREVLDATKK